MVTLSAGDASHKSKCKKKVFFKKGFQNSSSKQGQKKRCKICGLDLKAENYSVCMLIQQILVTYFREELDMRAKELTETFKVNEEVEVPIFVCSNVVMFPQRTIPVHITEHKYHNMLKEALKSNNRFGMVYGTDEKIPKIGTIAFIKNHIQLADGKLYLQVVGQQRFEVVKTWVHDGYKKATVRILSEQEEEEAPVEDMTALRNYIYNGFRPALESIEEKFGKMPEDSVGFIYWLIDFLPIPTSAKQQFLELSTTLERSTALKHIIDIGGQRPANSGNSQKRL